MTEVRIRRLENGQGLPLPVYASEHAAGMDLAAAVDADFLLEPGMWAAIPTGFAIELPEGFEAQIRPRSGLALKNGVTVLNAPGTIDADYRGEVKVILINHAKEAFAISRGMRIAQMVIAAVTKARLTESGQLQESARGAGGFGSTGA